MLNSITEPPHKVVQTSTTTSESNNSKIVDSKYRKIYRAMIEKSNQLDEIYKSSNSFQKIFQSETTLEREKLQRYCETLIFKEPIECGKKAEEILWRRVFYEIINIVKANKKILKSNTQIETMYRLHLTSAYGFYNHLMLKFQSEFNTFIQLDGFLDFPVINFEKQTKMQTNFEKSELLKDILIRMLHKFLICLGDLARYQIEYDPNGSTKLAYKYYQQSLILLYTNGMPLNQLGTLYCSENFGCDAAYYYLYCLSCVEPFMSAKENLRLLFIKNRKRYDEIKTSIKNRNKQQEQKQEENKLNEVRTREIKKFLVSFLRIIDLVLSSSSLFAPTTTSTSTSTTTSNVSNHQLQELCQLCLQEFNSCMFYKASNNNTNNKNTNDDEEQKLSYLSDELVFKLTMTILMSLEQLKNKRFLTTTASAAVDTKSNSFYFTIVAFALVFFSHIVNHTIIRLQESLLDFKVKKINLLTSENLIQDDIDSENASTNVIKNNSDHEIMSKSSSSSSTRGKSPKTTTTSNKSNRLIYGHRRRKHNSDSDSNDESPFENEDADLGEEGSTSTTSSNRARPTRSIVNKKINRKKNITKFLDRDNLSETELNLSDSDYKKKKKKKYKNKQDDDSSFNSDESTSDSSTSSNSSSDEKLKPNKAVEQSTAVTRPEAVAAAAEVVVEPIEEDNNIDEITLEMSNNQTSFKEFSTQLYSRLSILSNVNTSVQPSSSSTAAVQTAALSEEFIDNEIYKFVLNGKRQVSIPPGFEMNSKEAEEIEELGKKIATFQIETDTEMSIFNSDTSLSDKDEEEQEQKQQQQTSKVKVKYSAADFISRDKSSNKLLKNKNKSAIKANELENAQQLVDLLQKQAFLPTIKVFCDWLLCNKKIIQSISQVSTTIWSKLSVLLNCIPLEKLIANPKICQNDYVRSLIMKSFETKSWNSQPLSEDYHMRSFVALRLEHLALKFDINKVNQLNVLEENLLRLCYLRRFGYLIASFSKAQTTAGSLSFFEYDIQKALFIAPTITDITATTETSTTDTNKTDVTISKNEMKENRKLQLMRNMAQLRLEAEINQLESYKHDDSQLSPYIVLDTIALCSNLKLVQDFSRSKKFIIIIPLVVIDNLDMLKKESREARDTIRWLENQFKHGNRFLRAQTENEKIQDQHQNSSDYSSLKKKDFDLWRFQHLLDCCKYFQQESWSIHAAEEKKKHEIVTLLVNYTSDLTTTTTKNNYFDIAKQNHIKIINIKEFHSKLNLK